MLTGAKRFIPPTSRDRLRLLQFFFLSKGKNQKPKYHHYDSVIKDDMLQLDCPSIFFVPLIKLFLIRYLTTTKKKVTNAYGID